MDKYVSVMFFCFMNPAIIKLSSHSTPMWLSYFSSPPISLLPTYLLHRPKHFPSPKSLQLLGLRLIIHQTPPPPIFISTSISISISIPISPAQPRPRPRRQCRFLLSPPIIITVNQIRNRFSQFCRRIYCWRCSHGASRRRWLRVSSPLVFQW